MMYRICIIAVFAFIGLQLTPGTGAAQNLPGGCEEKTGHFCVSAARNEFSTDFSKASINLGEVLSGGPPKDGIPSIDAPKFALIGDMDTLDATEPVIGLRIGDVWRAYPLRVLMWHEIVNDTVGGTPISITFCPLCNAAIVFDRRVGDQVLDFGTTGRLRNSDLIMYDRQTESWWQQFLGEAIVGELTGTFLKIVPARLESFGQFTARAPETARILIPNDPYARPYGDNPYEYYDDRSAPYPHLFDGSVPDGVQALERVISLEDRTQAWTLSLIRERGEVITSHGVILSWIPGQNSALNTRQISEGKDVGTVIARKDGKDIAYFTDFAFAFHAFRPEAVIHTD